MEKPNKLVDLNNEFFRLKKEYENNVLTASAERCELQTLIDKTNQYAEKLELRIIELEKKQDTDEEE